MDEKKFDRVAMSLALTQSVLDAKNDPAKMSRIVDDMKDSGAFTAEANSLDRKKISDLLQKDEGDIPTLFYDDAKLPGNQKSKIDRGLSIDEDLGMDFDSDDANQQSFADDYE